MTTAERGELALEREEILDWLKPGDFDQVAEAIAPLMVLPAAGEDQATTDAVMGTYLMVLSPLPLNPLRRAVSAILAGSAAPVDGRPLSLRFRPTAAEIRAVTIVECGPAWRRQTEIRSLLAARAAPATKPDPERAAVIMEKVARFTGRGVAPAEDDAAQDVEADRARALEGLTDGDHVA